MSRRLGNSGHLILYLSNNRKISKRITPEGERKSYHTSANYDLIDEIELKLQKSKSTSDQQTERQTDKQMRTTQN